jgi:hypothetical protein
MKTKTTIILVAVLMLACLSLLTNNIHTSVEAFEDYTVKFETKLGTTYVIDNETLTIVDFSLVKEVFVLSDGREIHANLVFSDEEMRE